MLYLARMRTATIDDIKNELKQLPPKEVLALLLRLARFKKENKELLTYLLFESHDEQGYLQVLKTDITEQFAAVDPSPVSKAKKAYRKILRSINRQVKYIGSKAAAMELLIHYCTVMRNLDTDLKPALEVLYFQQLTKAEKLIPQLEDDLQFDFQQQLESLREETGQAPKPKKKFFRFKRF